MHSSNKLDTFLIRVTLPYFISSNDFSKGVNFFETEEESTTLKPAKIAVVKKLFIKAFDGSYSKVTLSINYFFCTTKLLFFFKIKKTAKEKL